MGRFERNGLPELSYRILYLSCAEIGINIHPDGLTAEVFGKLYIGNTIADHKRIFEIIIRIIQVSCKHTSTRLTGRRVLMRKSPVNKYLRKHNSFIAKLYHTIVCTGQNVSSGKASVPSPSCWSPSPVHNQVRRLSSQVQEHVRIKTHLVE